MSGISKTIFLQRSKKVHGDAFDYSEVEIDPTLKVLEHPPVKMRCKRHNYVFYENPSKHYQYKRYSHRKNSRKLPVCCRFGNDRIFLNGGYSKFLDKVEELGQTATRAQIAAKLGFPKCNIGCLSPHLDYRQIYDDIKKCERKTGRKVKIKRHGMVDAWRYAGQSGLIKTRWGLSLYENGVEKERECKSCHSMLKLNQFNIKSVAEPYPRRECKKCWIKNKVIPWNLNHPHYRKERAQRDPLFKLTTVLRNRMTQAISACKKSGVDATKQDRALKLLGAQSWRHVFNHFEALFTPGMTWENHGGGHYGKKEWHIDHIIPIDYFIKNKDFTLLEVQKECFNVSNLQPLWAKENISKSNRISEKDID